MFVCCFLSCENAAFSTWRCSLFPILIAFCPWFIAEVTAICVSTPNLPFLSYSLSAFIICWSAELLAGEPSGALPAMPINWLRCSRAFTGILTEPLTGLLETGILSNIALKDAKKALFAAAPAARPRASPVFFAEASSGIDPIDIKASTSAILTSLVYRSLTL